jgi:hypothetical protein
MATVEESTGIMIGIGKDKDKAIRIKNILGWVEIIEKEFYPSLSLIIKTS